MDNLLFHKDVYIPDHAKKPLHEGKLRYAGHARNVSAGSKSIDGIQLPEEFNAAKAVLVEVELNPVTGQVEKQVWRQSLDAENDLCFPMIADGFVKTVWLNHKKDTHKTLRKERYVSGFQWRNMKKKFKDTLSV